MTVLPYLTLADPPTTGEGALDPLGLSAINERLADRILPGLRARMSRPRFVSAMAVCAHITEGLSDLADTDLPPYLVFEWLVVEGFVRCAERDTYRGTPGTLKAQVAKDGSDVMSPRTYLRVPTVFGFHGVYKPLARNLEVVRETDDDFHLDDRGYELLKVWQEEQSMLGFLDSSMQSGDGTTFRSQVKDAVREGLAQGFTRRSGGWQGWTRIAETLAPRLIGRREAKLLQHWLVTDESGVRGEIFRHLALIRHEYEMPESEIVRAVLPKASPMLAGHLRSIVAYEQFASLLELAFNWIRYLSTTAGARPISEKEFSSNPEVRRIATTLPKALERADSALAKSDLSIEKHFSDLTSEFVRVTTPDQLFEAILTRHSTVQKAKLPDGKRDWFEREPSGATMVRVPYRLVERPEQDSAWNRPYRLQTARSFLDDFAGAA